MTERLTDTETTELLPLMIELAALIEPNRIVASRLQFAHNKGLPVREASLGKVDVDLVKLARFVRDRQAP